VLSAFADRGIRALPVKGIVTAYTLYDEPAARYIGDIDLRIRPRDVGEAVRVARRRGWRPETAAPQLGHVLLRVDGWEVDIESHLGPPGLCRWSIDDLLRRAEACVEPLGVAHARPELHDHVLVLVLNAFKDGLRIPPWSLEDIRRIARHPGFDAATAVDRARAGGVASVTWIVADWLAEQHGCAEWRAVRDRIGRRAPNRFAAEAYLRLRRGMWRPRAGLLVCASSGDRARDAARGAAFAVAGVLRGRVVRALSRASSSHVAGT
jgi:hypothetical protein